MTPPQQKPLADAVREAFESSGVNWDTERNAADTEYYWPDVQHAFMNFSDGWRSALQSQQVRELVDAAKDSNNILLALLDSGYTAGDKRTHHIIQQQLFSNRYALSNLEQVGGE